MIASAEIGRNKMQYKIHTLDDMLDLDDDQIDRLCAELPQVLKYNKNLRKLIAASCSAEMASAVNSSLGSLIWTDDGKRDVTCEIGFQNGENIEFIVKHQTDCKDK